MAIPKRDRVVLYKAVWVPALDKSPVGMLTLVMRHDLVDKKAMLAGGSFNLRETGEIMETNRFILSVRGRLNEQHLEVFRASTERMRFGYRLEELGSRPIYRFDDEDEAVAFLRQIAAIFGLPPSHSLEYHVIQQEVFVKWRSMKKRWIDKDEWLNRTPEPVKK
jgi:hypothetical protein